MKFLIRIRGYCFDLFQMILILVLPFVLDWKNLPAQLWKRFELKEFVENYSGKAAWSGLAADERLDQKILIYSNPERWEGEMYQGRSFFTLPVYHLEPSEVILNNLGSMEKVNLIYTNPGSLEELKGSLGKGIWEEFRFLQKYGNFSLLERKNTRAD